jgi:hypothetical protein
MEYNFHVFYHYPCNDGELSRVVWEYFEPKSCFYKWIHQNNHENDINIKIINNLPNNSTVVFLDLTPNTMNKLSNKHQYIIIDHHKNPILTLIENKKNLPNYNILLYTQKGFPEKNDLSGCKLTWLYFSKNNEDYPSVVYYIGSKDVWDFSSPNTESYCLGFNHYINNNFNESNKLSFVNKLLNDNNYDDEFINIGTNLIEKYKLEAINIFKHYELNTETINNINFNIIDINTNNINNNNSTHLYKYLIEFAQENFDDSDVLRILYSNNDNKLCYSLRSLRDNIKVDEIARHYGGNGHEKAAGYTNNINK